MSIRIIPQDELGSSEKRTADYIPPLLFPRLKNLYNRRAERLRELAENNPLGDFLRFAALIAHAQEVVLYDHPLQIDLTAGPDFPTAAIINGRRGIEEAYRTGRGKIIYPCPRRSGSRCQIGP
jgi:formate dehydrogenase maturation protein FdhE